MAKHTVSWALKGNKTNCSQCESTVTKERKGTTTVQNKNKKLSMQKTESCYFVSIFCFEKFKVDVLMNVHKNLFT